MSSNTQRLTVNSRHSVVFVFIWISSMIVLLKISIQFIEIESRFLALIASAAIMSLCWLFAVFLLDGKLEVSISNDELSFDWVKKPILSTSHPKPIKLKEITQYKTYTSPFSYMEFLRIKLNNGNDHWMHILSPKNKQGSDYEKLIKRLDQALRQNGVER